MEDKQLIYETWAYIVGFEGRYSVSNTGKVKSESRYIKKGKFSHLSKDKVLKLSTLRGYKRVMLYSANGDRKKYSVHRLVAQAFIPNPENKPYINHIDCTTSNNHVSNLEWCTAKENTQHAVSLKRMGMKSMSEKQKKSISDRMKVPVSIFDTTGNLVKTFKSVAECASYIGVGRSAVSLYKSSGNLLRNYKIKNHE